MLDLRESMTLRDVARHLDVGDWLVRDIEKRWLGKHFAKPRLKDLRHIAIDEIATKKGHKYLAISWTWSAARWSSSARGRGPTR